MIPLELLAPARDKECAIAAVNCGAHAVYIGPPQLGARVAAGNSIADIEEVVRYAHLYGVQVFATLNTLLSAAQLEAAIALSHQLYEAGVDALIIQDLRLVALRREGVLPPIPLHASTQTHNASVERVLALERAGLERVVLARELNLLQISAIRAATTVPLEAFVHGALCVSYSGRCYLSEVDCGRSANKGACAQYCRLPYQLEDAQGRVLLRQKHLLSLKDMDRSAYLGALADAGVTSFKIEGRLKDPYYVKNVTAYYRQLLDALLEEKPEYGAAAAGKCTFFFTPQPNKTFHRGGTPFFTQPDGTFAQPVHQWHTPKSTGERIGVVTRVERAYFEWDGAVPVLHNGDGLCFTTREGAFDGLRVNRVEGQRVYPAHFPVTAQGRPALYEGQELYRNQDAWFEKQLDGNYAVRKIPLQIEVTQGPQKEVVVITAKRPSAGGPVGGFDGGFVCETLSVSEQAQDPQKNTLLWQQTLSKLGGTPYEAVEVVMRPYPFPWFLPVSTVARLRRNLVEQLNAQAATAMRLAREAAVAPQPTQRSTEAEQVPALASDLASALVPNLTPEAALDLAPEAPWQKGQPLMTCKYCIQHALGYCPKEAAHSGTVSNSGIAAPYTLPLYLVYQSKRFRLHFDCAHCRMEVYQANE